MGYAVIIYVLVDFRPNQECWNYTSIYIYKSSFFVLILIQYCAFKTTRPFKSRKQKAYRLRVVTMADRKHGFYTRHGEVAQEVRLDAPLHLCIWRCTHV